MSRPISIYLHIPFCPYRCSYCDFNTYTSLNDLRPAFARALAEELRLVAAGSAAVGRDVAERPLRSVGFGGGTPSMMALEDLAIILDAVAGHYRIGPETAISLEANPENLTTAYVRGLLDLGVSRISIGAQSAVPRELELLAREHDFGVVTDSVKAARAAGLDNLNLDLIYGVPGQSMADWRVTLDAALALETPHLSLYCLGVEPGTAMDRWVAGGVVESPDPDLAADQYRLAEELLADRGYRHYEISNWCRPGFESTHSLVYWRNQEFLGLGPGAHGFVDGIRYTVIRQPRSYMRRLTQGAPSYPWSAAVAEHHAESEAEAMSTMVIMNLRLLEEGLVEERFAARFGRTVDEVYGPMMDDMVGRGLLERTPERIRLTEQGRFVSNQVFYRFV